MKDPGFDCDMTVQNRDLLQMVKFTARKVAES